MSQILQLKISLKYSEPLIWRRFLVNGNISFHRLHDIIQVVMGWGNYHLYDFNANGQRFSIPDEDWDEKVIDSRKVKLSILKPKQKIYYTYDFGDCWEHLISIEKMVQKDAGKAYPICIAGELSCPPEDCGSISGYYRLLTIKKNKKHPEYKHLIIEWLGEDFDPEYFDLEQVNKYLRKKFYKEDGRTRY